MIAAGVRSLDEAGGCSGTGRIAHGASAPFSVPGRQSAELG